MILGIQALPDHAKACEHVGEYRDAETKEAKIHVCDRPRLPDSRHCQFHDECYFDAHPDKVAEEFLLELDRHHGGPVFFIECNIPAIRVRGMDKDMVAYFSSSIFHGEVEFFGVEFKTADFSSAKFKKKLTVRKARAEKLILSKAKADSGVEFQLCNMKEGDFTLTDFGSADYFNCSIDTAAFRECVFQKKASVVGCSFKMAANFESCTFAAGAEFRDTEFHSSALFLYSTFVDRVKFDSVYFAEQYKVSFGGDLSNVSFKKTSIPRVRFDGNTRWGGNDNHTILDERDLAGNPQDHDLSSVLQVYRDLRENYEFYLLYREAGGFFRREMELKRKYFQDAVGKTMAVGRRGRYISATNVYNVLCGYGESFKRAGAWSAALFASALTYFFVFPDSDNPVSALPLEDIDYAAEISKNWLFRGEKALERTFGAFFQIGDGLVEYIVRAMSLPVLGTMFIVLRRRFERRFRH